MLKEKIKSDLTSALKAGQAERRLVLGMLSAAIKNREVEKRTKLSKGDTDPARLEQDSQLSDEEVIEVISSEIKKRRESIQTYSQAARPELAQKEEAELTVLMEYMPAQMSEDEIRVHVSQAIQKVNPSSPQDIGKVMSEVMPHVKGKADGQTVSRIVKEEIASRS